MQKIRTATGKAINMQELALKNERVRSIGNMNVNAAGDEINNENKTVATRTRRAGRNYKRQIASNVADVPVTGQRVEVAATDRVIMDDIAHTPVEEAPDVEQQEETGGLAGAIAKAKEAKNTK